MMSCDRGMVKKMNLAPWKASRRVFHVPTGLLAETIRLAKRDVTALISPLEGADPHSPVGTAFGFNRPKRQAAEIANTSLLLQFTSTRFVNSFLKGYDRIYHRLCTNSNPLPVINFSSEKPSTS